MRKLLNLVFHVAVCTTILISLSYLISVEQVRSNPDHIPSVLGFAPLTVISDSMSPGIETGDLVIIKVGNGNLKPGDIVTYRLEDMLITHRIKNTYQLASSETFLTQGDANSIPDYKLVESSQIVGKYVFRVPMGGYIKASLRGLPGLLIMVGLVLIVVMLEVLDRVKQRVHEVETTISE